MKKNKLEIDYGFDFLLLGLICTLKPHKLAWQLNGGINLDLARQEDHLIMEKDGVETRFIQFLHQTDVTTIRLLKNKSADEGTSKWLLVPEHPRFDYIMFIQSGEQGKEKEIIEQIKNIPTIELSAFLPLASLKRKENFMF
ncbi:MAG: IPExxxVDY family protein [Cyclobacteriaceae bacterium]